MEGGQAGGEARARLLANERGVDVASLLHDALTAYTAESFGEATFTRWVLLGLRSGEAASVRLATWAALDELSHKLAVAPPPPEVLGAWLAAEDGAEGGEAPAAEAAEAAGLLGAWESSLLHGRLGHAPSSVVGPRSRFPGPGPGGGGVRHSVGRVLGRDGLLV